MSVLYTSYVSADSYHTSGNASCGSDSKIIVSSDLVTTNLAAAVPLFPFGKLPQAYAPYIFKKLPTVVPSPCSQKSYFLPKYKTYLMYSYLPIKNLYSSCWVSLNKINIRII
jgi:hypothetical protein